MTNALDKDYIPFPPLLDSIGFASCVYGEPRMFGFRLKYALGEP